MQAWSVATSDANHYVDGYVVITAISDHLIFKVVISMCIIRNFLPGTESISESNFASAIFIYPFPPDNPIIHSEQLTAAVRGMLGISIST